MTERMKRGLIMLVIGIGFFSAGAYFVVLKDAGTAAMFAFWSGMAFGGFIHV